MIRLHKIIIMSAVILIVPLASAFALTPFDSGSIPPTPAWKTFHFRYNDTLPTTGTDDISAIVYNDELFIVSDGSILFNVTHFDP